MACDAYAWAAITTSRKSCIVCQAFAVVRFLVHYAIPVGVFAFCYGRIFHTIRRQSKVISGHAGRSQNIAMTTMSRDQNAGQVQQQMTGATTGNKLSRTELNVLKTMIAVIACFMLCWSVADIGNFFKFFNVSEFTHHLQNVALVGFPCPSCSFVCVFKFSFS